VNPFAARRARIWAVSAGIVAAGATAGPAQADGFSLKLTGPSRSVVGRPSVIHAVGRNPPPAEYQFASWLSVDLVRTRAVTRCPAGSDEAAQLAEATGGAILARALSEDADAAGASSIAVGFTARIPGRFLLCGYTANENGTVLAAASRTVTVKRRPGR
jgi:hypothetical protein